MKMKKYLLVKIYLYLNNVQIYIIMMNLIYLIKTILILQEYIEGKSLFHNDIYFFLIQISFRKRDILEEFNDKSHLVGMSERYARLGLVEDETDGEYDDEYDDTYDDGIVNVRDKGDTIDNELEKNENRFDIY